MGQKPEHQAVPFVVLMRLKTTSHSAAGGDTVRCFPAAPDPRAVAASSASVTIASLHQYNRNKRKDSEKGRGVPGKGQSSVLLSVINLTGMESFGKRERQSEGGSIRLSREQCCGGHFRDKRLEWQGPVPVVWAE